jgi:hypothetical protein
MCSFSGVLIYRNKVIFTHLNQQITSNNNDIIILNLNILEI